MKRVVIAVVIGTLLAVIYLENVPTISEAELQRLVDAELPMGTPRHEVHHRLSARGLPYSDNIMDGATGRNVGIWGEIRTYRLMLFANTSLRYNSHFDEETGWAGFT
ncbi:MAG: hypothetical protein AB7K24_22680 [Gemmataceae bacterium]